MRHRMIYRPRVVNGPSHPSIQTLTIPIFPKEPDQWWRKGDFYQGPRLEDSDNDAASDRGRVDLSSEMPFPLGGVCRVFPGDSEEAVIGSPRYVEIRDFWNSNLRFRNGWRKI